MEILRRILRERFTQTLREDEGGTYGVNVAASAGDDQQWLAVNFDSSLEKGDRMRELMFQLIDRVCREGVDAEEVEDQVMMMKKERRETSAEKGVNYWMHALMHYAHTGKQETSSSDWEKMMDKVQAKDVQAWAKRFFATAECKDIAIKSKQPH